MKHDTAQEAAEAQDCFSLDMAVNEIAVTKLENSDMSALQASTQ